jgi:hypothetical protein
MNRLNTTISIARSTPRKLNTPKSRGHSFRFITSRDNPRSISSALAHIVAINRFRFTIVSSEKSKTRVEFACGAVIITRMNLPSVEVQRLAIRVF